MAGIVAALEAHDNVSILRQPVDDLALPFVAPLGADDDNIGHSLVFPLPLNSHEHDPFGSPRPPDQVHGPLFRIMRPAQITAGAARTRGSPRDKGSGLSTQARTGPDRCRYRVQALDIPRKFVSGEWQRMPLGGESCRLHGRRNGSSGNLLLS